MNKKISILLSFLIPFLFIFIYSLFNTDSFYELYVSDLGGQYINIFDYLLDVFKGNKNIIYSFSNGLGGSMYGAFFYYLSSPLNIFLVFANSNNIHIFIIILIFIKIGLCGLTMYIYLLKNKNLNNICRLIFSTSYALMTFNIMYYFCTMWLDVIYLAPIILLFLDKILENKKSYLYTIFLFISIVSNYYMSYILCIFIVLYFIFRVLTKYDLKKDKKIIKEIIIKFIIHSLLAGLLASFMILPILDEMSILYRNNYYKINDNFSEKIYNIILSFGIVGSFDQFNISYFFPSFFVLSIIINYIFFTKDKDKKYILIIIIIFILSVLFNFLSSFWHAFTIPMLFQYRFAPFFVLFLIIIASEKLVIIKKISYFKILCSSLIYLLINYIIIYLNESYLNVQQILLININFFYLLFNFIFISILMNSNKKFMLMFLLFIEVFLNFKYCYLNINMKEIVNSLNNRYSFYENINSLNDNYRIGGKYYINSIETINNKSNIEMFISNNNKYIKQFFNNSGYTNSSSYTANNKNNIILNKLLGVKYWYNEENTNFKLYKNFNNIDLDIYIDNNALSLGYMIDNNNASINESNPFDYINSFTKLISNVSVYEMCDVSSKDSRIYKITNCTNDNIYIWNDNNEIIIKEINGNEFEDIFDNNIIELKNNRDEIIVELEESNKGKLYAAQINESEYNDLINYIDEQLNVTKMKKNVLEGSITVNSNKNILMLTIPYNDNFELYVDAKEVSYEKIFDTFIGVKLDKGYHEIKLVYKVKYLKEGIILSIVGILIFLVYFKYMSKNVKKKNLFDKLV